MFSLFKKSKTEKSKTEKKDLKNISKSNSKLTANFNLKNSDRYINKQEKENENKKINKEFIRPTKEFIDIDTIQENKNKNKASIFSILRYTFLSSVSVFILFITILGFVKSSTFANEVVEEKDVLIRLSHIISLPENEKYTIEIITNEEDLKKNEDTFYYKVSNGDYLIKYQNLFILYDFQNNFLKSVKTS